ncbi:hypothetical protein D3H34_27345 [Acidovorax cavernicola]|uniref:Uncharacterized protein n=1 Tax=Acidovorax cavernicola TaxID=1675792 RepID=A0A9X8CZU9_9BURK|nr:hypothetical protein D3H34_27345 [Acidovorax cavernicola]
MRSWCVSKASDALGLRDRVGLVVGDRLRGLCFRARVEQVRDGGDYNEKKEDQQANGPAGEGGEVHVRLPVVLTMAARAAAHAAGVRLSISAFIAATSATASGSRRIAQLRRCLRRK